jgi:bifunctional DNA-binding transcriptional regulator/antitoxin component of YhaV-PrlF toxin-antitoxin module
MVQSTLTSKWQTTVPVQVREALDLKPNQKLQWEILQDGSALVRSKPNALELEGSLKTKIKFPGRKKEREAVMKAIAEEAANEG